MKKAAVSQPPVSTDCPLTAALNAIGGKWSLICLYWLDSGKRRFNELRRLMPEISHKVLAATLRRLEHEGLICRTVYPEVFLGRPSGARSATEVATGASTASRRGRIWDNCLIRITVSQARSNFFHPAL